MITGCDISSNNNNWKSIIDNNNSFVIIKATEGRTYRNRLMQDQATYAEKRGKLIGFYHYARPENGNSPKEEAANFINAAKPYIGKAVLILDYEDKAHGVGSAWACAWLKEVKKRTGVMPMFYTSEAFLKQYSAVARLDAGLWVAKYSVLKPKIAPWKIMAMWQYRSYPYDKSRFYGDSNTWAAYAKVRK